MAPARPELLEAVQELEVEASTEVASIFRLRLGIAQTRGGDWSVLEDDSFRPLVPVAIRVQNGMGPPQAVLNGYVSGQEITYADRPGESFLEVTGMDATIRMNLEERVKAWPNLSDSSIAAAIVGQYGLLPQVQATSPSIVEPEGTITQRSTDIRFLRQLARRNGFECYVQPEPFTGLDMAYFRPAQLAGPPQAVLSVNIGPETNVSDFKVHYELLRPTTARTNGLEIRSKQIQTAEASSGREIALGSERTLARVSPSPVVRPAHTGLSRAADLQTVAQAVVDRSSWAVVAEGRVGPEVGVLRPGGLVNVRGAGRSFNGSYYLTRVLHTLGRDGYLQRFTARRNALEMTGSELYVEL
jgi:phage protein D